MSDRVEKILAGGLKQPATSPGVPARVGNGPRETRAGGRK